MSRVYAELEGDLSGGTDTRGWSVWNVPHWNISWDREREFTPCSEMCCLTWTKRGMLFNTLYGIVLFSGTHHTQYMPKLIKIHNIRACSLWTLCRACLLQINVEPFGLKVTVNIFQCFCYQNKSFCELNLPDEINFQNRPVVHVGNSGLLLKMQQMGKKMCFT